MNTLARLKSASTAPKGQPHDRQHHNVMNGLPATDYSVWSKAKEKFARKGRYEHE